MAKFQHLILHCTATPEGRWVTPDEVRRWHTAKPPFGRGWKQVGYSDLILLDGSRHQFVKHDNDLEIDAFEITNGVAGINSISRHMCYVGGLSKNLKEAKDTRTDGQKVAMEEIIHQVLAYAHDIKISGHNQWDFKACPSFYVPDWLDQIGIPEKNILRTPSKVKL